MRMLPNKFNKKKDYLMLIPNPEEEKKGRLGFIEELEDGDMNRFLRRNWLCNKSELIYSKVFPKWKKSKQSKQAMQWVKKKLEYPNHIIGVVNIMITLNKYYNFKIDKENIKHAYKMWDLFDDYIYGYNHARYKKRIARHNFGLPPSLVIPAKAALKEQKARGFIHINDYEDYDRIASHVWSTVDGDYLWPTNCCHGIIGRPKYMMDIYIIQHAVGVQQHTRCQIPKY